MADFQTMAQIRAHRFAGNYADDRTAIDGFMTYIASDEPEPDRLEAAHKLGEAFGESERFTDAALLRWMRDLQQQRA